MSSPLLNAFLPLVLLAATGVPTDPARAEAPACERSLRPAAEAPRPAVEAARASSGPAAPARALRRKPEAW